jgi:DNA primase catalytic subunit
MRFEDKYFAKFNFTKDQINKNLKNAFKDLGIAKRDKILEVKFNYAYTALIKGGLAFLSYYNVKIKSVPGHHIKIIEKLAQGLNDDAIIDIGNIMRAKRNLDLYMGGIEITEKECHDYISMVEKVLGKIEEMVKGH